MSLDSETAVARAVLIHGPISRSALTTRLDLSPASLTRLTRPLLDRGLLIELDEVADGSIGRRSRPLAVAPDAGRFLGIKLTGDRLYAVHTDVRATVLDAREVAIGDTSPAAVCDLISAVAADLSSTAPHAHVGPDPALSGVGICLGGSVRHGIIENASFLGWTDVDLVTLLNDRLDAPVTVENDLIALAEAERWFGVGRDLPGFVVVTIGAGVGYALVINGQTIRTPDAGVGTGGHIPLSATGPVCADGHRGCARALLTSGSIAGQVSAALGRTVTFDDVLTLADEGAPAAGTVIDDAARALGVLLSLATNLTLQSSVVLAGEGVELYERTRERVHATLADHRDPLSQTVTVHVDDSGFTAWARGAAAVAIQHELAHLPARRVARA